jgi:hypothetical protein
MRAIRTPLRPETKDRVDPNYQSPIVAFEKRAEDARSAQTVGFVEKTARTVRVDPGR